MGQRISFFCDSCGSMPAFGVEMRGNGTRGVGHLCEDCFEMHIKMIGLDTTKSKRRDSYKIVSLEELEAMTSK